MLLRIEREVKVEASQVKFLPVGVGAKPAAAASSVQLILCGFTQDLRQLLLDEYEMLF